MAGVTTWADFVTELTTNHTVTLGDNIDLYDDYPYGVDPISLDANTRYEIHGDYNEIRNLRTKASASLAVFNAASSGTEIYMENIDFRNLIVGGVNFISNVNGVVNSNTDKYPVEFKNCRFAGERSGNSYLVNCPHIKAASTYFNMPWMALNVGSMEYCTLVPRPSSSSTQTDYIADYCRFHEHYGGWVIEPFRYSNLTKIPWSCFFFKMSGCRVEGDMTIAGTNISGYTDTIPIDLIHHANRTIQPTVMNVADIHIHSTTQNTKVSYNNWFGLMVEDVTNADGIMPTTWVAGHDISTNAYIPLLATPEQAASELWLYENGFDI